MLRRRAALAPRPPRPLPAERPPRRPGHGRGRLHGRGHPDPGIRDLLQEHPNLSFDLSSKNPLYGRAAATHPMLGLSGIDETWRQLFEAYPDRFFLGVDFLTAGMLARAREVADYYRTILTQLTPATARKIGYENAVTAYGLG